MPGKVELLALAFLAQHNPNRYDFPLIRVRIPNNENGTVDCMRRLSGRVANVGGRPST